MSSFDASRWADAFLAAAGAHDAEAYAALDEIAQGIKPLRLSTGSFSGGSAASHLRSVTDSLSGLSPGVETARRLVVLLCRAGRLSRIGAIVDAVRAQREVRDGIVRVRAESAFPLDDQTREGLCTALKKRTGAEQITLEEKIDPELLGGLRISIGYERIDGTLRRRLEALASATGAAKRGGGTW